MQKYNKIIIGNDIFNLGLQLDYDRSALRINIAISLIDILKVYLVP